MEFLKPSIKASQQATRVAAHHAAAPETPAASAALATLVSLIAISSLIAVVGLTGVTPAAAAPYIGGFVEGAQAIRIDENEALVDPSTGDDDLADREYPRSELRVQLTAQDSNDLGSFFTRIDLVSDATDPDRNVLDVREAYIKLYPFQWMDLKFGRQVATWGTGDLIFANDLFAKDWEAFFTGLDDSYLKPPQDLLRMSFYPGPFTAELALAPYFTADELPDGRRLSVYNPFSQSAVGELGAPAIVQPQKNLTNGEVFARVYDYAGSFEWAIYGYKGFWPTPQGIYMTPTGGGLYYPKMYSGGASLRGPVGSYLVNVEGAAYITPDDEDGDDPLLPNSQLRGFVGVEKSLGNEWTVSTQYYGEYMLDYEKYEEAHLATFGGEEAPFEELRSTVTARISKSMRNQTLRFSLFGYAGLTDEDWHLRPSVSYKIDEAITWTTGANLIDGEEPHTMFGQFRDNSNIYMRLRYSF